MSDLREALDMWGRFGPPRGDNPGTPMSDLNTIVAAARRFLALTETGPDYEAAKIQLHEILREAGVDVFVNSDLVVDAALADYLTEEET